MQRNPPLIGIGIAVVLGTVIIGVLFLTGEFGAGDPTPAPTEFALAMPTLLPATPTIIATPDEGEPAYPAGSLPAMLAMAPDRVEDDDTGLPVEATYADLERWLEIAGVDPVSSSDAAIASAMIPLEFPGVLQTRGLSQEWRDVYGFSVRDVDQVVTIGHARDQIVIMRGDFSADVLYDTWVRNGYQAVEVEETTVWSLYPGDRIDLTAPASRPALGLLNNIMVFDGGTLVASARQSGMADFLRVVNGDDPSLLEHGDLEQAVASWTEAGSPVSAILADGTIFEAPASGTGFAFEASEGTAVATALAHAPLPEVELVLFGLVPSNDPDAAAALNVLMIYDADRDAVAHVPVVVSSRAKVSTVGGGTASWTEEVRLTHVEVVEEEGNLVEVRFELLSGPDA